jgi:purine-cytosine permease-like protein
LEQISRHFSSFGGEFLIWFKSFLVILGTLTTSIATVIAADYFIVRKIKRSKQHNENVAELWNWAGVLAVGLSFGLAHFALVDLIKIEVLTAIATVLVVYPLLRPFCF